MAPDYLPATSDEQDVWFDLELDPASKPVAYDSDGNAFPVARAQLRVRYVTVVTERPFIFGHYADRTMGAEITQAAIAPFDVEGRPANLVVVANRDGSKSLKVVFDKHAGKADSGTGKGQ